MKNQFLEYRCSYHEHNCFIFITEQSLPEAISQKKVIAGDSEADGQGDNDGDDGDVDAITPAAMFGSTDEAGLSSDSEIADEFPSSSEGDSDADSVELAVEKKSKKLDKLKARDEKLAEAELKESASAPEAIYELPTAEQMVEASHDLQTVHQRYCRSNVQ